MTSQTDFERQAISVVAQALELPAEEQAAFLSRACEGNASLRHYVESLLASQDADGQGGGAIHLTEAIRQAAAEVAVSTHQLSDRDEVPFEETEAALPQRIGSCVIRRPLGKGGFGHVYQAYDEHLQRDVALKLLKPEHRALLGQFVKEARIVADLKHPGIVEVYHFHTDGEFPAIEYEFVDGGDLRQLLASPARPTWQESARLVADVADALQHAHNHKYVHLDIKPANILLDKDGRPRIADFGLAATTQQLLDGNALRARTTAYAPPEQLEGSIHKCGRWSDIYSLGVVLYELLCGHLPPLPAARCAPVGGDTFFRGGLDATIPEPIVAICRQALALEPDRRIPSAAQMGRVLRNTADAAPRVRVSEMSTAGPEFLGREEALNALNACWSDGKTHVVTIIAPGGMGKTALLRRWLAALEAEAFRGARNVLAWSFNGENDPEEGAGSSERFLSVALRWFRDPDPECGSSWDKGERLAQLVRKERTLLILDGLEALQYPPGERDGGIRDPGIKSLLRELAVDNHGLCVVSTFIPVADLLDLEGTTVQCLRLPPLTPECAAELLQAQGVRGEQHELEEVARDLGGHALALTLTAKYLTVLHGGDVRYYREVGAFKSTSRLEEQALRVVKAYERCFAGRPRRGLLGLRRSPGTPELDLLRIISLFDGPADRGAIEAVCRPPAIKGLTSSLCILDDARLRHAIQSLRECGLLTDVSVGGTDRLESHSLVQRYFAHQLRTKHPRAWRLGHDRLYRYYTGPGCERECPSTLEGLSALYAAIRHGAFAGWHEEVLREVYARRIHRGTEFFGKHTLGAYGADLAALAAFFEKPWSHLAASVPKTHRGFVFNEAAYDLAALGRMREAAQAFRAALQAHLAEAHRRNAPENAITNTSQLALTLLAMGQIAEAIGQARESVRFATIVGHPKWLVYTRAVLAHALHQAGQFSEAQREFKAAEAILQKDLGPDQLLFSYSSLQYCELLLDLGEYDEVCTRAEKTVAIAQDRRTCEDGLGHALWGCACMLRDTDNGSGAWTECKKHIDHACAQLSRAGQQQFLATGYLARAQCHRVFMEHNGQSDGKKPAGEDLDRALFLVLRGEMNLYKADACLERARLSMAIAQIMNGGCLDRGDTARVEQTTTALMDARTQLMEAQQLVDRTGYRRRSGEIELETARLLFLEGDCVAARGCCASAEQTIRQLGCTRWAHAAADLRKRLAAEPS